MHTETYKHRRAPLIRKSAIEDVAAAAEGARVKQRFEAANVSIAAWAKARGFSPTLVYEILQGKRRCVRGESKRIAVALGLKDGALEATSPADFDPRVEVR